MQKLALLIGSPLGNLTGVKNDLKIMQRILKANGFTTTTIDRATKAQILKEWNTVTNSLSKDDVAVFYYSGHGGTTVSNHVGGGKTPRQLQYLLPFDFYETTAGNWRGIADVEISQMLSSATDKTRNVTCILDCCHAAGMARLPGTVKTMGVDGGIDDDIQKMLRDGKFEGDCHPERNPNVVTIAASSRTDSAYEQFVDHRQMTMSVLVEALEGTLTRLQVHGTSPTKVSWRTIMQHIRDRVRCTCSQQSPRVEGEDRRFAFSLDEADAHGGIPISYNGDGIVMRAGKIYGVRENDVYSLLPFHEERLSTDKEIAQVVVTDVGNNHATARFEGSRRPTTMNDKDGMKAFLKKRQLGEKLPVAVPDSPIFNGLRDSMAESCFVRVAREDESPPLATIAQDETRLQIYSHDGNMTFLFWELQLNGNGFRHCVTKLESLARCRHLQTFEGHIETFEDNKEAGSIADGIVLELGRVRDFQATPIDGGVLTLVQGDRFYLKIRNKGPDKVYVSVLSLCAGSAQLVSTRRPLGYLLSPRGGSYTLGSKDGHLEGVELRWPEQIPKDAGEIPEHLLVLVTDLEEDFRRLQVSRQITRGDPENDSSLNLAQLVDILSRGGSRDVVPEAERSMFSQLGAHLASFRQASGP